MFVCIMIITKSCPEAVFEAKVSGNSQSAPALQEHLLEHRLLFDVHERRICGRVLLPGETVISSLVVITEIPKSSHPHVSSDENSNGIVHFSGLIVVVQQEKHLHAMPSERPFLSRRLRLTKFSTGKICPSINKWPGITATEQREQVRRRAVVR